jgi:putative hydrolase of the HAD superfamily
MSDVDPGSGTGLELHRARTDAAPLLVLFDLDDTLFAHRAAVDAALLAQVRVLGAPYTIDDEDAEVDFWQELEELHYHAYLAGTLDYEGQRRARARDYAARHGLALDDTAATEWFDAYFEHYVDNWMLHEDAVPALDELLRAFPGVRLGLITNGDAAFQARKIAGVGLADRFEEVVASGAFGVAKPDPAIFRHACELFGVPPEQSVYVGDRFATDAVGAARAGLTGVWLNRTGARLTTEETATAAELGVRQIASLVELVGVLSG